MGNVGTDIFLSFCFPLRENEEFKIMPKTCQLQNIESGTHFLPLQSTYQSMGIMVCLIVLRFSKHVHNVQSFSIVGLLTFGWDNCLLHGTAPLQSVGCSCSYTLNQPVMLPLSQGQSESFHSFYSCLPLSLIIIKLITNIEFNNNN